MAKQKVLSDAEVKVLIKEAQNGSEEAMEKIVESNTRLVWSMVQRFSKRGYELDDLFQIGVIGLMKAIKKFNLEYEVKFSTYGVPMIIGEIQRFLRDDGIVKVSRSIKELVTKIRMQDLTGKTPEEIMEVLEIDNIELVKTAIQYIKKGAVKSIDETIYENDGDPITIQDQLQGDVNGDWLNNIALQAALLKLTEREQKIITCRFFKDMTQQEVATEFGVSQVQVSRLEKKAILKMKEYMEEETEMAGARGNKEKAIELLRDTTMTLKEICDISGVPVGSLSPLSKIHRAPEVAKANNRRAAKATNKKIQEKKAKEEEKPVETPVIEHAAFRPLAYAEEILRDEKYGEPTDPTKNLCTEHMGGEEVVVPVAEDNSQTVFIQGGDIVVEDTKTKKEIFRVMESTASRLEAAKARAEAKAEIPTMMPPNFNTMGTQTGRFTAEEPQFVNVPNTGYMWADTETSLFVTPKPAVTFDFGISLGGEGVSKDEALASLTRAMDMVKMTPTDTITVHVEIKS